MVDAAIPIVNSSCIDKRVRDRILSSLGNAENASIKNALYEISQRGTFSDALVKLWIKLRNKSAHAVQLQENDEELQKFIDDLYGCLELFYALLLSYIGYLGPHFEYSKKGWPVGACVNKTILLKAQEK